MSESFTSNALLTGDGKRIKTPATLPDAAKVLQVNTDGTSEHVAAVLESQRNAANGFAGLNGDGDLVGTILHRTGTDADLSEIVLQDGETAFCSDTGDWLIGDGTTPGGSLVVGGNRAATGLLQFNGAAVGSLYVGLEIPLKPSRYYQFDLFLRNLNGTEFRVLVPATRIHPNYGPVHAGHHIRSNGTDYEMVPVYNPSVPSDFEVFHDTGLLGSALSTLSIKFLTADDLGTDDKIQVLGVSGKSFMYHAALTRLSERAI